MKEAVKKKVEEKTADLARPNYLWMAIFFALGCLFLFASLTALPFIIISPGTFNMYFSLFSLFFILSISFYYGPMNYLKSLFEAKNLIISVLYIGSTIASLSTIFIKTGYLWSIGLVVIQAFSLCFFILQALCGGERATQQLKEVLKQKS